MLKEPVIVVIDVGKTNKKLLVFDQQYNKLYEVSAQLPETVDEDGFSCDNVHAIRDSVFRFLQEVLSNDEFDIRAINFSGYGASFVYIDDHGLPVAPLYNYLKPYPEQLQKEFYARYGGEEAVSLLTASPVLGNLNSGLQLYRIKKEKPALFGQMKYALHLPQYLSFLVAGKAFSDLTSIGCHTCLWNFQANDYHAWVYYEGIYSKLAPIVPADGVVSALLPRTSSRVAVGIGVHDSSAALIPYQLSFIEPFVLISTGTWSVSMNPFNKTPLTVGELHQDCLCYMHFKGQPVKASRLFSGNEHDEAIKRIGAYFNQHPVRYVTMDFRPEIVRRLQRSEEKTAEQDKMQGLCRSVFSQRDLSRFRDDEEAYHQLMLDIVSQQKVSTQLVINGTEVGRLFVDGGFSKNDIYMNLLAAAFPHMEVFAASMPQATALGAALTIHHAWNSKAIQGDLIQLKHYAVSKMIEL